MSKSWNEWHVNGVGTSGKRQSIWFKISLSAVEFAYGTQQSRQELLGGMIPSLSAAPLPDDALPSYGTCLTSLRQPKHDTRLGSLQWGQSEWQICSKVALARNISHT